MTCERIVYPNGDAGWMCGDSAAEDPAPACSVCGAPDAEYLCDGPAPGGESRATCDAPLCSRCTAQTDPLVTIPTDRAMRCLMRWAGGNVHAAIGAPIVGKQRRDHVALAHELGLYDPEPHDYCPRCSARAGRNDGGTGR